MNGAVVETDYRLDMLQLRNIEMQSFATPMLGKVRGTAQKTNLYPIYCSFCNRHVGADAAKTIQTVPPRYRCAQCESTIDVLASMRFGKCLCIPCLSRNGETCTAILRR